MELIILGLTGFFVYNAYHDGKYTKFFMAYKKYIKMITIGLVGISIYILFKRNPMQSKKLLLYANNVIKYMPIDKSSVDMISPIFDLSSRGERGFMENFNSDLNPQYNYNPMMMNNNNNNQMNRNLFSGIKATKRSVSETKKKYVASNQDWKCGGCGEKLTHTFEVDHKVRLEHGGGNDVTNLVALCRNCHGNKTAMENM